MADDETPASGRRLPRHERREQILAAATGVFAGVGFPGTGLDDIAAASGVSRAILYRHFESKTDLYRAALERARRRMHAAVGDPPYAERIIDDLLTAAVDDPDGFRLLFRQTGREPTFRAESDRFDAEMAASAHAALAHAIPDAAWARWAAHLAPAVTIAAITAWLDSDEPQPGAAARIRHVLRAINDAAVGDQVESGSPDRQY